MVIEATVLAGFALVLAWPAPVLLARAGWPARHPAAGLVLWQGIGLSGGLALLTTELTVAAAGRGGRWPVAVWAVLTRPTLSWGLLAFGVTGAWLLFVLARSVLRVAAARRRHRYLLDLLARRSESDVDILAHTATVAYSVPGRRSRIVISQGASDALSAAELAAVIEHERAHLRQHHDVVIQPFLAWRHSFPFLATAAAALRSVERLTEYLADDAAVARVGAEPLAAALAELAPADHDVTDRRHRLGRLSPQRTHRPLVLVAALAGAATLVLVPPTLLLFLT
jgi:Zn-dependent protease with chaperone function